MKKPWSDAETANLLSLFPTTAIKDIAAELNRPTSTVAEKASKLGLKKSAEYRKACACANGAKRKLAHMGRPAWNRKPYLTMECKWCKQPFEVPSARKNAVFCGRPCMTAWRKTITGEAHWLYTLETCVCKWCENEFKAKPAKIKMGEAIFCSRQCHGASTSFAMANLSGPTSIERKMQEYLAAKGVAFVAQHRIGPWCVDVFVPSLNLIIECDGDYWHSLADVKKRDKRKNYYLEKAGYTLARITEAAINADVAAAISAYI